MRKLTERKERLCVFVESVCLCVLPRNKETPEEYGGACPTEQIG